MIFKIVNTEVAKIKYVDDVNTTHEFVGARLQNGLKYLLIRVGGSWTWLNLSTRVIIDFMPKPYFTYSKDAITALMEYGAEIFGSDRYDEFYTWVVNA